MNRINGYLGFVVAFVVTFVLVSVTRSWAETHMLGQLPRNPRKAAFTVTVEIASVAGDGYQPIDLTFKPRARTFTRDHRVSLRLSPRNNFVSTLDMAYDHQFLLPEGATQHEQTIYVPYYYPWDTLVATLREDGRSIETGRTSFNVSMLRTRDANQHSAVGVLIPRDADKQDAPWKKCPDLRTLVTVLGEGPLPDDANVKRLSHKQSVAFVEQVQPAWVQFRPIDEDKLHSSWIGYSQLDIMIVAAPLLCRIETEQPDQLAAIDDWITAGGNLWVYGQPVGESPFLSSCNCQPIPNSKITAEKRVRRLLKLHDKNDNSDLIYEHYQGVRKSSQDYASRNLLEKMPTRDTVFKKLTNAKHAFARIKLPVALTAGITTTRYGLGTVTRIDDEDPFPQSFQLWHSVANLHDSAQIQWFQRNGVKPAQGNSNYWSWLIASVGKPPVKSFILLNTLFVIVIGPLAYFFFRRRERLYLLFFFAPAFAMLVTLSLFGYAMLADGTATRMRTRQLTWVDSKHGNTTTQSRQTYYAVLGSGSGLSVANDVAVFPVLHSTAIKRYNYHHSMQEPAGVLTARPDHSNFSGSFLPARNQVQYTTIHPNAVDEALSFDVSSDPPSVTNGFPFEIHTMMVCDERGQLWSATEIAPGATATLDQASPTFIENIIDDRVIPNPTDIPMLSANRNTTVVGNLSLLENKVVQWANRLPSGHFVAEADLIESEFAVDDAVVSDSVHLIMGEMP